MSEYEGKYDAPVERDPLRQTGRTTRMLKRVAKLAADGDVLLVAATLRYADALRQRLREMSADGSFNPSRVRLTTPSGFGQAGQGRRETVVWDHFAKESRIAQLRRELAAVQAAVTLEHEEP